MKNDRDFVICQDVPVRIFHKIGHIHKIGKAYHRDFTKDWGDIPVAHYNAITEKFEAVVNTRGYGYAKRRDIRYRKRRHDIA